MSVGSRAMESKGERVGKCKCKEVEKKEVIVFNVCTYEGVVAEAYHWFFTCQKTIKLRFYKMHDYLLVIEVYFV